MHVELADVFRCTSSHSASWLVAAAHVIRNRRIEEGILGCPVCGAEFPIHDGVVDFRDRSAEDLQTAVDGNANSSSGFDEFRIAALLGIDAPGKTIALVGYPARVAAAIQSIVPVRIVVVNPGNELVGESEGPVAVIRCHDMLPIASASLQGLAANRVGLPTNAPDLLEAGGRLLAPVSAATPAGMTEIARDQLEWVAARDSVPSGFVKLRRQSSAE